MSIQEILQSSGFEGLMDNVADEVIIWNSSYEIVYANKTTCRNYGLPSEYLVGKTLNDCWVTEQMWVSPPLPEVFADPNPIIQRQKTCLGISITTISTPVFNAEHKLEYVVQVSREDDHILFKKLGRVDSGKELIENSIFMCKAPVTKRILQSVNKIAKVNIPILILGETGTGKSLLAKHIHHVSERQDKPFVAVNMASIPPSIMEAEFFGYKPGAFTGALPKGKKGFFEVASGGTLFLDEIGEIPVELQAKFLYSLHENEIIPLGGSEPVKVDVRIISATNCNLGKMIQEGRFRKDLYHRLNAFEVALPPLRERKEDILLMAFYFLNKYNLKYGKILKYSDEALYILEHHDWNGNIRELSNTVERCVVLAEGSHIGGKDMPEYMLSRENCVQALTFKTDSISFDEMMREHEAKIITQAYKRLGTSRQIARSLKLSQSKAHRLVQKHVQEKFFRPMREA